MPCQSDESLGRTAQHDELDRVTRLLCLLCKTNEETGGLFTWPAEVKVWWINHKALDRKRAIRQRVLSSLSQEEREALGL
jgi:hypothetical protein